MKNDPDSLFFKFDKIVALLCLVLTVFDFIDVLRTVFNYSSKEKQNSKFLEFRDKLDKAIASPGTSKIDLNSPQNNLHNNKDKNGENLPRMLPLNFLSEKEAKLLKYKISYHPYLAHRRLLSNKPILLFATSTIQEQKIDTFSNTLSILLEGPIFRIHLSIFSLLLVSMSHLSTPVSLLCLTYELGFLIYFLYPIVRYSYHKSWLLIASKINMSLLIILITAFSFFLSLFQAGTREEPHVNRVVQYTGFGVLAISLAIETVLLIGFHFLRLVKLIFRKLRTSKSGEEADNIGYRGELPMVWVKEEAPLHSSRFSMKRKKMGNFENEKNEKNEEEEEEGPSSPISDFVCSLDTRFDKETR